MKLLEGFTEIEADEALKARLTDKRLLEDDNLLIQEMRFGENNMGRIRIIASRNTDAAEHQKIMDTAAAILYEGYLRKSRQDKE